MLVWLRPYIHFLKSITPDRPMVVDDAWSRTCWSVWYQRSGTSRMLMGTESWVLRPEAVFLGQPGAVAEIPAGAHLVRMAFAAVVREDAPPEGIPPAEIQPDAKAIFGCWAKPAVPSDYADDIRPILRQIDIVLAADPWTRQEASLRLGAWMARYFRAMSRALVLPGEGADLVARAEALMRNGTRRRYTVPELAKVLGVSASALDRAFVKAHGHGPGEHMQRLRLQEASNILVEKEWPIKRVAAHVGFSSVRGLQTAFVRAYGMTPRRWRQQARS